MQTLFIRSLKRAALAGLAALALASAATPAFADTWWDHGWSYRERININTTASGANIASPIGRSQILVRLHSGNFAFSDASSDGADLRFIAGDDATPLKFHVEKYDAQAQVALIWVDVAAVAPNASAPIYLYYGSHNARAGSDAHGTYAPDQALVFHFSEDGAPRDASANGANAETPAPRDLNGLIGNALRLDGQTSVKLPASPALTFAPTQPLTISMWVKLGAGANGVLYDAPGAFSIGLTNRVPYVESGAVRVAAPQALATDTWAHIALVADGTTISLYVNGLAVGQAQGALPAFQGEAQLGQGLAGEIDEFEIAKAARSQGQIALATKSQGLHANLLAFDRAEQTESGNSYFGVLFAALTPDAWAVIAILALMSIGSWIVMISKGLYVNRLAGANEDFLVDYRQASSKRALHEGLPQAEGAMGNARASLARLYGIGQRELDLRFSEQDGGNGGYALAPQSIAAIRSALDAGAVREGQKLNKQLVFLTIAISGGPFLGLLGTVVGVMITFAAVAAAGDVNITAIAPGIAAALLATVAGLAVAIPALFGYNYLLSRIEAISADMAIFVDELEKRIAETYRPGAGAARSNTLLVD